MPETDLEISPDKPLQIRASSLPGEPDCSLRWAASTLPRMFPEYFRKKHPDIRKRGSGVGASVGTACHKGSTNYLESRMQGLMVPAAALDHAVGEFKKLADAGMEWDQTTGNIDTAEFQIKRMVESIIPHLNTLNPKFLERRFYAKLDTNYELTGELDIYELNGTIRDLKFGKNHYWYLPQLGAYSLLLKSAGESPTALKIDFLKRTARTKPQAPLDVIEYPQAPAESAADRIAYGIMERIERFRETGNQYVFPANPNSMLCSKTWCPAHSTSWCDMGKTEAASAA